MENARFTKNDNEFICKNCGKKVEKLGYTSRDHCNFCLHSVHVDVFPGDRLEECKGLLVPVDIEINSKKGYVVIYKCEKCGATRKNILAKDDDMEVVYEIMRNKSNNF